MNKKFQKGIVAAMAATMGTGIVAPVYAAQAATTDLAAQYSAAYNATTNALSTKNQKDLTAARVLVDGLYNVVKGTADEYLATTLSQLLDPAQQVKLVDLDNAIKAAEKSVAQADVNKARALIVDMPTVWKNSFSSYIDGIQQQIITRTANAIKAAQEAGKVDAYNKASDALKELLTVTNNDGVKSFAEGALKAELAKVVAVSGVSVVSDKQLAVTFVNEVSAKTAEANFEVTDKTVEEVKVSGNTVTLTVNSSFADGKEYTLAVSNVADKTDSVKLASDSKAFAYKVGAPDGISLTQNTFQGNVGGNIKNYIQVKDSNGQVVTREDYNVIDVQSSDTTVVDGTGAILARGTANVRVLVEFKNGEQKWSDFMAVTVNTPVVGQTSGWTFEDGVKSIYANTLKFANSGAADHDVALGEASYVHMFKKDTAGNPLATEVDLSSSNVTVSGYDTTLLNVVHDSNGIRVEGKRLGSTSMTIKNASFTETITITVKAAPELAGFKAYSNVNLLPDLKSGAVVATSYYADAAKLQADINVAGNHENGIDEKLGYNLLKFKDQYGEDVTSITSTAVTANGKAKWDLTLSNGAKLVVSMAEAQYDAWYTKGGTITVNADGTMDVVATSTTAVPSFDVSLTYFAKAADTTAKYKTSFKLAVLDTDGKIASYKVVTDINTIDSSDLDNDKATFTAVALDSKGNILSNEASDMLDIAFDAATVRTSDQNNFINVTSTATEDSVTFKNQAADYLDQDGSVKIAYSVVKSATDKAAGVTTINYTNSRFIPVSAVLPTDITVDLSNTSGTVTLEQILFGIVNSNEINIDNIDQSNLSMGTKVGYDGYVDGYAPRVVLKDQSGKVLSLGATLPNIDTPSNNATVLDLGYKIFGTSTLAQAEFGDIHYTNIDGVNVNGTTRTIDENVLGTETTALQLRDGLEKGTLTVDIDGLYLKGDTRSSAKNLLGGMKTIRLTIVK